MMTRRMRQAKITGIEVMVKEGTSVQTSTFWVTLTRDDGSTQTIQQCYVSYFGYDEWIEMIDVLIAKPNRNKYERAWMRALEGALEKKSQLEVALELKPSTASPPPARPLKRKATEETSGSSPKRQA